jgi:hypothetical protein
MVTVSDGGAATAAYGHERSPHRPLQADRDAARAAVLAEVSLLAAADGWACVDVRALAARLRLPAIRVHRLLGDLLRAGALCDAGLGLLALPSSDDAADQSSSARPRGEPHAGIHDGTASELLG